MESFWGSSAPSDDYSELMRNSLMIGESNRFSYNLDSSRLRQVNEVKDIKNSLLSCTIPRTLNVPASRKRNPFSNFGSGKIAMKLVEMRPKRGSDYPTKEKETSAASASEVDSSICYTGYRDSLSSLDTDNFEIIRSDSGPMVRRRSEKACIDEEQVIPEYDTNARKKEKVGHSRIWISYSFGAQLNPAHGISPVSKPAKHMNTGFSSDPSLQTQATDKSNKHYSTDTEDGKIYSMHPEVGDDSMTAEEMLQKGGAYYHAKEKKVPYYTASASEVGSSNLAENVKNSRPIRCFSLTNHCTVNKQVSRKGKAFRNSRSGDYLIQRAGGSFGPTKEKETSAASATEFTTDNSEPIMLMPSVKAFIAEEQALPEYYRNVPKKERVGHNFASTNWPVDALQQIGLMDIEENATSNTTNAESMPVQTHATEECHQFQINSNMNHEDMNSNTLLAAGKIWREGAYCHNKETSHEDNHNATSSSGRQFSVERFPSSHIIDIPPNTNAESGADKTQAKKEPHPNDEGGHQNTDFSAQEPNSKVSSSPMAMGILGIVDGFMLPMVSADLQGQGIPLMPKYCSRTILGLLALSLSCLFCVGVFCDKRNAKYADHAIYVAYACTGAAFLMVMGFLMGLF